MDGVNMWKDRSFVTSLALVVWCLGLGAGCPHPRVNPEHPQEPPLPIEVQAANFQEIVVELDRAVEDGWQEEECRRIAARFVELSDRARGMPEALFNAAMALRQCDLDQEASALLDRANAVQRAAVAKSPGFAPALLVQGTEAARRNDRARAKQLFDAAREADPRSAMAYTNLASIQRQERQWAEAQRNIRRALAVDSHHIEAYTQMALLYYEISSENPDMLDLTSLVCQQAVARAAETRVAPQKLAPLHNVWGLALVKRGDIVGATLQFDKARQLDPELFEAHMNFGSVNISFRGYEEAERAFAKALALRPDSYDANISLGVALRGLRRFDEARAAYQKARELMPDRPDAYYNLGVLAQDYLMGEAVEQDDRLELLRSAKQSYQQFLDACRRSPDACVRLRPEQGSEDLVESARRRLSDCDLIAEGLAASET